MAEEAEALAGRPSELRMVTLALELGEDHEREHDLVLGEARDRQRIGEEDGGVDDVDGPGDQGTGDASPLARARRAPSAAVWDVFTLREQRAHLSLRFAA